VSAEPPASVVPGFVDAALRAEFPGLRLDWVTVPARLRESPRALKRRLLDLSSRYRGASVIAMRTKPIPHAYRAFFRQIGLDPDLTRIPSEEAAVARLLHGQFRPENLIDDALLLALIETGVPVWALDGGLVDADARRIHALLFGDVAPGHEVTSRTERVVLFAVGVEGVPAIHIEEALWVCAEALATGSSR
jgi:DNA/RNA-binding domain of Phe-tRNA-synthetase-like protein